MNKELIIIRHARSKYNVGATQLADDGITDWGKKQAFNVGQHLRNEQMCYCGFEFFTSPFLRCLETASFLQLGPFRVLPGLREYLNHHHKEATVVNRSAEYQQYDLQSHRRDGTFDWRLFKPDGETYHAETNEEFIRRMVDTYHALPERSLVVTHGLPAFTLLHIATTPCVRHIPVWDYSIDNASITWIRKGQVIWHGKNLHHEIG